MRYINLRLTYLLYHTVDNVKVINIWKSIRLRWYLAETFIRNSQRSCCFQIIWPAKRSRKTLTTTTNDPFSVHLNFTRLELFYTSSDTQKQKKTRTNNNHIYIFLFTTMTKWQLEIQIVNAEQHNATSDTVAKITNTTPSMSKGLLEDIWLNQLTSNLRLKSEITQCYYAFY